MKMTFYVITEPKQKSNEQFNTICVADTKSTIFTRSKHKRACRVAIFRRCSPVNG